MVLHEIDIKQFHDIRELDLTIKWSGNSYIVRIPKTLLKEMNLDRGDHVRVILVRKPYRI